MLFSFLFSLLKTFSSCFSLASVPPQATTNIQPGCSKQQHKEQPTSVTLNVANETGCTKRKQPEQSTSVKLKRAKVVVIGKDLFLTHKPLKFYRKTQIDID